MGLINKGWGAFKKMLDKHRFQRSLKQEMPKAMRKAGEYLEKEYKDAISRGNIPPPNAPLTMGIKKHGITLLDSGRMRDAIRTDLEAWDRVVVGIPKNTREWKVARIVSEGANVEVTDRMRAMFDMLWHASEGRIASSQLYGRAAELWARSPGNWFPLGEHVRVIRIPARPFMQITFGRKAVKDRVKLLQNKGLKQAWRKHVKSARGK